LEIYKDDFEAHVLTSTGDYYARESIAFIAQNGTSLYMQKAEARLEEEQIRAKSMLDPSSQDKVSFSLNEFQSNSNRTIDEKRV
jgi:hypothetical protein